MGGNQAGVHHPLAAGTYRTPHGSSRVLTPDTATSGAAATIASDAFMNPFDGKQHNRKWNIPEKRIKL